MEIIYCADGNKRLAQIAIDAGFLYGARLPGTIYWPIFFADQNWKQPDRARYMNALAQHKPTMATVLDLESYNQLETVLTWADEASQHVQRTIIIIPKLHGIIRHIPTQINGKEIRLGYSVPTKFGATTVPIWEFAARTVHLLGGSPHAQMRLSQYLDTRSVDGNMHQLLAIRYNQFWTPGNAHHARNRFWPTLKDTNNDKLWRDGAKDANYEAFTRSCHNIFTAWQTLYPNNTQPHTTRSQRQQRHARAELLANLQPKQKKKASMLR